MIIQSLRNFYHKLSSLFPLHLLLLHLRSSQLMVLIWVFFGSITLGYTGRPLGLYHLFWSPEYLNENSHWAYLLLGAAFGLFTMTFHIASYLYYSIRFPFLATLSSPLFRFSINNSAIPLGYFAIYTIATLRAHLADPLLSVDNWGISMGLFILGATASVSLTMSYFFGVNQRFYRLFLNRIRNLAKEQSDPDRIPTEGESVRYYFSNFYTIRRVRSTHHYDRKVILDVLQGHHNNASYFFILLLIALIALSYYRDLDWLSIPAAASFFLLASFVTLLLAVLHTRLKEWYITGILVLMVFANFAVRKGWNIKDHRAFGMDYGVTTPYQLQELKRAASADSIRLHLQREMESLNQWKKRTGEQRPVLVLTNVSGGGMRSALFSFEVMAELEQVTQGRYSTHNRMITGASGGMLGAAFFRENLIRNPEGLKSDSTVMARGNDLARDALNDVVFSFVVGDLFINPQVFEAGGYTYRKDRGYAFEEVINQNTGGYFRKSLGRYTWGEEQAMYPRIIFAPVIVGDGRRLIISSSPASYLTVTTERPGVAEDFDGVEFRSFFNRHHPEGLVLSSAIRMSATFPYITPLVQLPTDPVIEVIDAGARDNTGVDLSMRYLYMLRKWINKNTSGVVVVRLRSDDYTGTGLVASQKPSLLQHWTRPINGVINSFDRMQEYERAEEENAAYHWLRVPLVEVPINLLDNQEEIGLSWHLTETEKHKIRAAVHNERNRARIEQMPGLLQSRRRSR